ncbi:TonB-dependent receptor [Parabacteroides sp. PF5-6]|uniref:SusC/RagA family TonB-linked outer membrane protein n=1 Tax=Parabacteroides sp. PF5-6 TaxID=1742403 RepID=UPI002404D8EF|nr:TonB-dependent receptor [Parabacteroides sp. PF5-6]MDF9831144.1 TonB-linked SusC/RagA family outer membrane protein [Parabacteroides sp. PF5-6]
MMKDFNISLFSKTMLVGATMLLASVGSVQANPTAGLENAEAAITASPQQAKITIKGVVSDASGPIIGANVVEKGTTNGTITNFDGEFTLSVAANATLVISYIGYIEQQIPVNNQTTFNILLAEDTQALDEVVVVAYGVQKKVNLTGSVSSIGSKKLESRAVPNLSTSLVGLAPGMTVRQTSGNPGSDGASIRIRGIGTFDSNSRGPMVIVDGSVGSMDSVNPDDVESISVLKDAASSSIYGSRGANGVILITTKKGRTEAAPRVTYSGIVASEQPSRKVDFITDYADYMTLFNRAQSNMGHTQRYNQSTIDAWRKASQNPNGTDNEWGIPNYLAYPNTDWFDALFENNLYHKHNLSVSGGSKNSNYLLSMMYMDNPGTMENTGSERYQFRINAETKIANFLTFGTQTYASKQFTEAGNTGSAFTYLFQTVPGMTPQRDGKYGFPEADEEDGTANNPFWFLNNTGGEKTTTRVNTTWYAVADIYDGLSAQARFNYQDYRYDSEAYAKENNMYSFRTNEIKRYGSTLSTGTISYDGERSYEYTAMVGLNYNKSFGDHDVSAMVGYEQYYKDARRIYAQRHGMMDFSLTDITTATENDKITGFRNSDGSDSQYGAHYNFGMLSWLGRVNYAYKGRYLFEASVRRDASSRFSPDNRWGTFPSASAGWRISEEEFMKGSFFDNLKLRANWGKLGNTTSGYYDWQATYGKTNTSFGGVILNGLAQSKLANALLQWENVNSFGIGVDASVLNQRLNLEVDYYNRLTEGILTSPSIYLTMGTVGAPTKNTSDMRNQGIELNLTWNDQIGKVQYMVNANFSYNQNEVVAYKGKLNQGWEGESYKSNIGDVADINGTKIRTEGYMFDEFFMRSVYKGTGTYKDGSGNVDPNGGPRDGMIRTEADLQWVRDMQAAGYSFATNTVSKSGLWYGEFILADNNGDKIYGNTHDRKFTGKSEMPKYSFGLNASAAWNGFDFSMTWAGNAGMYYYMNTRGIDNSNLGDRTVLAHDAATKYYYYNEENPSDPANNINAEYPRLKYNSSGAHYDNERYLHNASYIKLKNLQVGYTLPKTLIERTKLQNVRVFVAGENLITITNFPGLDPEMSGSVNAYPTARMLSAGLNLVF